MPPIVPIIVDRNGNQISFLGIENDLENPNPALTSAVLQGDGPCLRASLLVALKNPDTCLTDQYHANFLGLLKAFSENRRAQSGFSIYKFHNPVRDILVKLFHERITIPLSGIIVKKALLYMNRMKDPITQLTHDQAPRPAVNKRSRNCAFDAEGNVQPDKSERAYDRSVPNHGDNGRSLDEVGLCPNGYGCLYTHSTAQMNPETHAFDFVHKNTHLEPLVDLDCEHTYPDVLVQRQDTPVKGINSCFTVTIVKGGTHLPNANRFLGNFYKFVKACCQHGGGSIEIGKLKDHRHLQVFMLILVPGSRDSYFCTCACFFLYLVHVILTNLSLFAVPHIHRS